MTLIDWVLTPIEGSCEKPNYCPRFWAENEARWSGDPPGVTQSDTVWTRTKGGSSAGLTAAEPELLTL